jgi:hypothetical protein
MSFIEGIATFATAIVNFFVAIKNLFAKLFRWRHDYRPGSERFQQLDTHKIALDLSLSIEGERRGVRNDPPITATTLDDIELRIATYVEAERNHCHDRVIRDLSVYDERLASFAFLSKLDEVKSRAQSATAQFLALRKQGQSEILGAERRVTEAWGELAEFRAEHHLRRPATFPDSLLLRWGVIGLIVVVESAVNGVIFAASNSFGLIGGVIYALVLSALNVGLGLAFGRLLLPQLVHRSVLRKLVGLLSTFAYAALVIGLNLLAAHYRDLSRGVESLEIDLVLIPRVFETPFKLREFSSWMLFVLGLVFTLIAAADGFSMDDPYPGYGPVTRRGSNAMEDFNESYALLLDKAEEIRTEASDGMTSVIDSAEIEMATYRTLIDGRHKLVATYRDYVGYLRQCAQELLEVYRSANRKARSTPAPATFTRSWDFGRSDDDLRGIPSTLSLQSVDDQIRSGIEELRRLRTELTEDHRRTVEEFASLRDLINKADGNGVAGKG